MVASENKISVLAEKYADMIFRLALSYTKNSQDAEDVVQDVFIKLLEKNISFINAEHEKAWIIRVTINVCKNKLKTFWNKNTCSLTDLELTYTYSYSHDNSVFKAVMELPPKYRVIIHLYYYEGYKTPEIAELLKKRESTVRSILHRAREQLKIILKEEYEFE